MKEQRREKEEARVPQQQQGQLPSVLAGSAEDSYVTMATLRSMQQQMMQHITLQIVQLEVKMDAKNQ